jgi:hypothetical protein
LSDWPLAVSPTVSSSLRPPHRLLHRVTHCVFLTASPSPSLSPCLPLCLPHCVSLTVSFTVSPTVSSSLRLASPSHSLCLPLGLPHFVSLTVSFTVPPTVSSSLRLPHRLLHRASHWVFLTASRLTFWAESVLVGQAASATPAAATARCTQPQPAAGKHAARADAKIPLVPVAPVRRRLAVSGDAGKAHSEKPRGFSKAS